MIPWYTFESRPDALPCPVYPIQEYWLSLVARGPDMTQYYLDSPMLEATHERRFVVSQEGGVNSEFESNHKARIDKCLALLIQNIRDYAGVYEVQLQLPDDPMVDHAGLWLDNEPPMTPAALDLSTAEIETFPVTSDPVLSAQTSTPSVPRGFIDRRISATSNSDSAGHDIRGDPVYDAAAWRSISSANRRAGQSQMEHPVRAEKAARLRVKGSGNKRAASSSEDDGTPSKRHVSEAAPNFQPSQGPPDGVRTNRGSFCPTMSGRNSEGTVVALMHESLKPSTLIQSEPSCSKPG